MENQNYNDHIKRVFIDCVTNTVNYIDSYKRGTIDSSAFRLQILLIASKYLSEYDESKLNEVNSYLSTSLIEYHDTMIRCETLIPDFLISGKASIDILSNEIERCISSFFYSLGGYLNSEK